jgi:hypothetical protein
MANRSMANKVARAAKQSTLAGFAADRSREHMPECSKAELREWAAQACNGAMVRAFKPRAAKVVARNCQRRKWLADGSAYRAACV